MNIRKLNAGESVPYELLLEADPSRKIVEKYIRRGECYIAEEANIVVGVYVILPTRPETVEMVNLSVLESEQGKGLGKKLVLHAIEIVKDRGFQRIEIGTGNSSIGQLALYQKCGFRIVGVDIDFFSKNYSEEIYENGILCRDMIRLARDL
ncbi:GNAT family N-acetyltransferase [Robertmurraya korlensis]|uniref:GNAT family N-acetyltransferase n=1 Tax=Robertmurraya korlensis TaxID=519977 RepID=UPI00203E522F|nr:GNAT family N-acetyltransferase [Robertmurraya korlensis]MCM3600829.1 GNAT family N-acetyltransferase [Robertmurraya korlensis]